MPTQAWVHFSRPVGTNPWKPTKTTLAVGRFRVPRTRDKSFDNRNRLLPLLLKSFTNLRCFVPWGKN